MLCACCNRKRPVDDPHKTATSSTKSTETPGIECDDSKIPLSRRQKYLLTKNWKGISREVTTTGVEMFVRMFSTHPEYFELFAFRNIANSSIEQQMKDDRLRAHADSVIRFLGQAISCIGDSNKFFQMLRENGISHAHRKNFKPEMFWAMEEPFLYAVKLVLNERYTATMDIIYKIVIKLILEKMEEESRNEFIIMNGQA